MKASLFIFTFCVFIGNLNSEEVNPKFTLYGTAEYFESRFVRANQRSKTNLLLNTEHKNTQVAIEKRGETPLGSIEYKNKIFYISANPFGWVYSLVTGREEFL